MTNILVTGSNGQLGKSIRKLSASFDDFYFTYTDVEELDITNPDELEEFFKTNNFHCLINCAAYTAVDKAEEEPENAKLLNAGAVKNLSTVCQKYGTFLIHVSTDYVFDGKTYKPYSENDEPGTKSVYGRTKLEGEKEIIRSGYKSVIIRTSWLYSEFGHNFFKSMIRLGKERESLNVVFDQVGTPTYATDLARGILLLVNKRESINEPVIFNFSNEGSASWYDFATAIMEILNINCKVLPILTKDYPLPAPRPFYSILDKSKIKDFLNIEIPHWRNGLNECIKELS